MDIYAVRERIKKENINFMNLPLRVTFYARVSTEFNVQLNSLDNQITYYTDFIPTGNMLRVMLMRVFRVYRLQSVNDLMK